MFKERRSRGSTEGPVKFLSTQDLLFGQKKLSFTGTGFKPTFLEISFIIQRESNNQIRVECHRHEPSAAGAREPK
jgi:hypothetical protein